MLLICYVNAVSDPGLSTPDKDARIAELEAALAAAHVDISARDILIDTLRVQIARLKRMQFGKSSEKLDTQIAQLELALEELEGEAIVAAARRGDPVAVDRPSPVRTLPAHLPREEQRIEPDQGNCTCPDCGGVLRPLGQDSDEMLDAVPVQWRVVRTIRPKYSCRSCEKIVQAPAPVKAIARGKATFGTLAHVVVSKFDHHLPLYRQAEIMAAQGIEIDRSTLAGWVGQASVLLDPIVSRIREVGLTASKIHADDTPVPMLDPRRGKTATGRLWAYAVDDRGSGATSPPLVWYEFTTDRTGAHPQRQLASFTGYLQADGYAGYDKLYDTNRVTEVACWAHFRRKIFDIHATKPTPLTTDLLERIGQLYEIEAEVRGHQPDIRRRSRQDRTKPLIDELHEALDDALRRLSPKSEMAKAIAYGRKRWVALTRFLDDGRLEIDNNIAERAMRCVATTDSYYTSSSNVRKQGLLVFHFDATRASVTRELGHFVLFQVRGSDLVRRIGYNLLGREHALLDQSTDPMGSNPKLFGGFGQREPLSILFGGSVAVDFVDSAQRADTARCPGLALSGLHSHPVESGGNVCIGPPGGHGADDGKGGFGRTLAMFACFGFANAQLRMLATFPVDRQNDFTLLFIDISDDIGHERAEELLTTTHVDVRRAPSGLQVGGNASKIWHRRGQIDLSRLGQTRFTGFHTPERCFPAILELGSDQAVIRVAGSIATFSERCLVSGLLQVQLHHAVPFFQIIPMRPISFHCGLDRHRRHGSQYLFAYGRVDARCAKSHASWLGQHLVDTFAAVIGMTRRPARIDNAQPSSTSAAGEQAREQRAATTTRLDAALLSEGVDGDMALVPFKLTPIDIAFVMILEQHFPRSKGLAVAVTFACPAIDNLGSLLAFTIDIDPSVEGVLQDRNNASIANRHPVEGHRFAAVRRAGKMEIVSCQRNQC